MAELKQHAWLLSLVALLLIVKFIIVPIFDWQDMKLAKIILLEKKQAKIDNVLTKKSNNVNADLDLTLAQANKIFFSFQPSAAFKLEQQKMLESMLEKHKVKPINIGWKTSTFFEQLQITRYPLNVQFTGKTIDIIKFLTAIEAKENRIEIESLNLSIKGQRTNTLGRVNGSITLNFFMNSAQEQKQQNKQIKQSVVNISASTNIATNIIKHSPMRSLPLVKKLLQELS